MKKLLSIVLCFTLLCLGTAWAEPAPAETAAEPHKVETRQLPVYNAAAKLIYEAMPVYYLDGVSDLPYVDVGEFVKFMNALYSDDNNPRDNYMYEYNEADKICSITYLYNNSSALVDFGSKDIFFSNFNTFAINPIKSQIDILGSSGFNASTGLPELFKRTTNVRIERPGQPRMIPLNDYGIPMIQQDGKNLLPLHTTFDLLVGKPSGLNILVYCNGKQIVMGGKDTVAESQQDPLTGAEISVPTEIGKQFYAEGPARRSEALAAYGVAELCMELDTFYGLKDAHNLNSFTDLLLNTDFYDKLADPDSKVADEAVNDFINFYMDDLHSAYLYNSYLTGVSTELEGHGFGFSRKADFANTDRYGKVLKEIMPEGRNAYQEIGNTAYVTFDTFAADGIDYYNLDLSTPDCIKDTISLVLYCHNQITRENSPVQNVVLDMSMNTGGAADAAVYVIGWFLGEAVITNMDTFTGAQGTATYLVDTNRDREFDDSDSLASRYNLYCLTSPLSFSCGNLVPWVFKTSGLVTLIGDTTGGGSCVVMPMTTAWGTTFQMSGNRKLAFVKNGSFYDVDRGVEPDVVLTRIKSFFEREKLTDMINNLK